MDGLHVWESIVRGNIAYVVRVPAALATLLVIYVIVRVLKRIIVTGTAIARIDPTVRSMILSVMSLVGWVFAVAAALSVMQLNQLSLALGGSLALVAMALATGLNSITQDLMAGIFLLGDQEFTVGRRVRAGGVEGTVESLSIRKTKIRDHNGHLHTLPNRNVDQNTYVLLETDDGAPHSKVG